jgi:hypothetical protein
VRRHSQRIGGMSRGREGRPSPVRRARRTRASLLPQGPDLRRPCSLRSGARGSCLRASSTTPDAALTRRRAAVRGELPGPHRQAQSLARCPCPRLPHGWLLLTTRTAPRRGGSTRSSLARWTTSMRARGDDCSSTIAGAARQPIACQPAPAFRRGCRIKPFRKPRGPLAEWAASAAERDDLTTEHTRATNEMAVFGARP